MVDPSLLRVDRLTIRAGTGALARTIVDSISFEVGAERVALVGESGSGKSLTARALVGLLRPPLGMQAAGLSLGGVDLRRCGDRQWARVRGAAVALMLQDPRFSLNPVLDVGRQLDAALRLHARLPDAERRERIEEMLVAVGLADIRRVLRAHPHELSGGMGQRVGLALALINGPRLLIADEPTSALDPELRDQMLALMVRLVETRRMGLLMISHDLPLVARHCERVLVLRSGRIVDRCGAADLAASGHAYTRSLWACRPSGRTYGTVLPVPDRMAAEAADP